MAQSSTCASALWANGLHFVHRAEKIAAHLLYSFDSSDKASCLCQSRATRHCKVCPSWTKYRKTNAEHHHLLRQGLNGGAGVGCVETGSTKSTTHYRGPMIQRPGTILQTASQSSSKRICLCLSPGMRLRLRPVPLSFSAGACSTDLPSLRCFLGDVSQRGSSQRTDRSGRATSPT